MCSNRVQALRSASPIAPPSLWIRDRRQEYNIGLGRDRDSSSGRGREGPGDDNPHAILAAMSRARTTRAAAGLLSILLFILSVAVVCLLPPPLAVAATTTTTVLAAPPAISGSDDTIGTPPAIKGKAAILIDAADGRVIYAYNADARRAMASTTKIMTGILSIESLPLDRVVTASKKAADVGESEIGLAAGEQMKVQDLLYALMVQSANDVAVDLAEASAGSVSAFVAKMNEKAAALGLTNTHYTNPHGLDQTGHYSSARDLASLARYAMQNPLFRTLVSTETTAIPWPGHPTERSLKNHNLLLGKVDFVTGVKTGFTNDAMMCLVSSGTQDGTSLIAVVMGSQSWDAVDSSSVDLLEYGFSQYHQEVLTTKGAVLREVPVPYHYQQTLPLAADSGFSISVFGNEQVQQVVEVTQPIKLPVDEGAALGTVRYTVGGRPAGEVKLVAIHSVGPATLGVRLRYLWDRMLASVRNLI
ncbi:MAG: D-alanyl-D-alanine carboxypeptidase [Actinobacteria bacterium]|nr:D-alanyl-D-alanine carboxypeptidase [Actinomycetota bacterium]